MKFDVCINCDYSDCNRINDEGKIRCKRYSTYVDREGFCENYHSLDQDNIMNLIYKESEKNEYS